MKILPLPLSPEYAHPDTQTERGTRRRYGKQRFLLIAPLLVALLLVTACGGGGAGDGAQTPSPSPTVPGGNGGGPTPTPEAPTTGDPTPVPSTPAVRAGDPLYIALGDSISYGVRASVPEVTGFVPLVHNGFTIDIGLLNLGVPGYTSSDLLNEGELDRAISEITARLDDGIDGNEVAAVTLEIGGNDLLNIYFDFVLTGTCISVEQALEEPACVNALRDALDGFETNLDLILSRLRTADSDLPVFLMTLYNPFSGGDPDFARVGDLALEGEPGTPFVEGLNDIIREAGPRYGTIMVELYPLFEGRSSELVAFDQIHPNDDGYAVIADALLAAMSQAGLPVAAR